LLTWQMPHALRLLRLTCHKRLPGSLPLSQLERVRPRRPPQPHLTRDWHIRPRDILLHCAIWP
jgi:hypothetical protein